MNDLHRIGCGQSRAGGWRFPSARSPDINSLTMASTVDIKPRGRRPGQAGTGVLVRLQPAELAALDIWIAKHAADVSRPEAIRTILREKLA